MNEMAYHLRWQFEIISAAPDDELLEQVDCVMQELLKLEECEGAQVRDAAVGLDADRGHVEIEITVDAADLARAIQIGERDIRTAVHAAGGYTPGWERGQGRVNYDFGSVTLEQVPVEA
jgi:hypothetical protein